MKKIFCSIFCILCLLSAKIIIAQPSAPVLRIENGMHTAQGNVVVCDSAGHYLLTCSDDKTARLWDAATGTLLRTLRIPISGGNEGKLYACAITATGKLAALSGNTGYKWDTTRCIYLINTQTGEIMSRVKGIPNAVYALAFSPDGKWLAAGVSKASGVYIYDTKNWKLSKILTGYANDVYSIAFNRNNQLTTVCFDGKIRNYNNTFDLVKQAEKLSGNQPFSITYSPLGDLLAVAYYDTSVIEIRNANDLSLSYTPSTSRAESFGMQQLFTSLSFSADGSRLYGGGYAQTTDSGVKKYILRIWNDAGKGNYTDVPLLQNTIMNIKPLPNGNMVVVGGFPDISCTGRDGRKIWYRSAENNDFSSDIKSHFRLSANGSVVQFTAAGQPSLSFDVKNLRLSASHEQYQSPRDSSGGTIVAGWLNSDAPRVNGNKLTFMDKNELFCSADVSTDGKKIVLGTLWNLYLMDNNGGKIWAEPLPEVAWAVKISENGKVVAAALADGTIRWYSISDGKELLAFYLNSDEKRWVLFTPQGYYNASPGAEDFLGWHINNGPDKAPSFYPISRFRDEYYRPDIIDAIFETYDEKAAIIVANEHNSVKTNKPGDIKDILPPTIIINSPVNGSETTTGTVSISYTINTPANAPVKNIKALVNGRPVPVQRGLTISPSNIYTIQVNIPEGNNTVTLLAENDHGVSPDANLFIKYKPANTDNSKASVKPKLYVLAIGISLYNNPAYRLQFADIDAQSFITAMKDQKGAQYAEVDVKQLINSDATRENIEEGLTWIQDHTGSNDIAMIFYAGHGINDNTGIFYLLPVGADVTKIRSTCVNFEEIKQPVSSIKGKVVVFIDACHSGNVMGNSNSGYIDINAMINKLSGSENGAVTFTSSTSREYSLENNEWKHGAFTLALLEGLSGKAVVPGKSKITIKSLDLYISDRVADLTNNRQHPTTTTPPNVPDFQIGLGK